MSKVGSGILKEACSGRRGKRTSQRGGVGTLAGRPRGRTPALRLWRVRPSLRYELGWGAVEPAGQIQEVEFLTSGAELSALKPQPVTQGALSSTTHGWHPLTRSAASLSGDLAVGGRDWRRDPDLTLVPKSLQTAPEQIQRSRGEEAFQRTQR